MGIIDVNSKGALGKAAEVLRGGGIVMHPTETCYGLAVDVFNEDALRRLYEVKGMRDDKPVSILVDGLEMAEKYGEFSDKARELAGEYWPGPLSILVPRGSKLPGFFNPAHEYVSIRHSSNEFCNGMVGEFNGPVTTTSANRAGEVQLYEVPGGGELIELMNGVDLVVDGGEIDKNLPSTLVKVSGDEIEVLRKGSIVV